MTRDSWNTWQNLGLATLTALTLASVVWLLAYWPPAAPAYQAARFQPQATTAEAAPRTLAVIGDSYAGGAPGIGGVGDDGWPALLAKHLGYRLNLDAAGGTGYVSGNDVAQNYLERAGAATRYLNTRVVIFEGSRNDSTAEPALVAKHAREAWSQVRDRMPKAHLVVVGPIWSDINVPAGDPDAVRLALKKAARAEHIPFIDPVADRWFMGGRSRFIGSDRVHPTNTGHRRLARLVYARLDSLGYV